MGHILLLQNGPAGNRAQASKMDGMDGECRAAPRHPDFSTFDRLDRRPDNGCDLHATGAGTRDTYDGWMHRGGVFALRVPGFTDGVIRIIDSAR